MKPESTGGRLKFTQGTFRCAELNLGDSNYTELVDLRATDIEPPFIVLLIEEELRRCLPVPVYIDWGVLPTQSTERAVRLTTEAAAAVTYLVHKASIGRTVSVSP